MAQRTVMTRAVAFQVLQHDHGPAADLAAVWWLACSPHLPCLGRVRARYRGCGSRSSLLTQMVGMGHTGVLHPPRGCTGVRRCGRTRRTSSTSRPSTCSTPGQTSAATICQGKADARGRCMEGMHGHVRVSGCAGAGGRRGGSTCTTRWKWGRPSGPGCSTRPATSSEFNPRHEPWHSHGR